MLTQGNYSKGLLIDNEWMGGVSEHPEQKGLYIAYVMNHLTAEYVKYGEFKALDAALDAINSVDRSWKFEKAGGCSGCSGEKNCTGGTCKKKSGSTQSCCSTEKH